MVTLEMSKLFGCLGAAELGALRHVAREQAFPAGQDIFKEGEQGDGVYLVKDGLVDISVMISPGTRRVLSQLGPGELLGEMAVLEFKPRSATATAMKDTVVYFIPRAELLAMVERSPALALALLRDISQRLREFDRRYIEEMLQTERLSVIGRFARSIVHDLKNPLNIIGLTAEMAAMEKTSPEARQKAAGTIRKQVERITDLVGEILEFTQGSKRNVMLARMDYAAYVHQVIEELRAELDLRGARIEVEPPPALKVRIDPNRLRRVFANLIHNAGDAMPDGGRITARFRVNGGEVVTEIEDTGPGIAPEVAGRLFEAFVTHGKAHGTGLGLSISKRIVEDHGGRIWATNQAGKGAVFAFTLPIE